MPEQKPLIRAGNWELGQNLPPKGQEMVNNPELLAFFGALGLVFIFTVVATILGLAQDSKRAQESRNANSK